MLCIPAAQAGQDSWLGHDGVSISSAVSITESSAIRFGNFTVTSPGDASASIVLDDHGNRTVYNGGATTITLLNGGNPVDVGGQDPVVIKWPAPARAPTFMSLSPTIPARRSLREILFVLTGPTGSNQFTVDTLTFNQSGSDGTGPYRTTNGSGGASILVGATLHTQSGATTYAPGKYTGTFEVMISY